MKEVCYNVDTYILRSFRRVATDHHQDCCESLSYPDGNVVAESDDIFLASFCLNTLLAGSCTGHHLPLPEPVDLDVAEWDDADETEVDQFQDPTDKHIYVLITR